MSEIKGQLLGIILTVSIFGIVAAAMATAFNSASETIGSKVENVATTNIEPQTEDKATFQENQKPYKLVY